MRGRLATRGISAKQPAEGRKVAHASTAAKACRKACLLKCSAWPGELLGHAMDAHALKPSCDCHPPAGSDRLIARAAISAQGCLIQVGITESSRICALKQ